MSDAPLPFHFMCHRCGKDADVKVEMTKEDGEKIELYLCAWCMERGKREAQLHGKPAAFKYLGVDEEKK